MGFFDIFDKIDDIIYRPIDVICDWIEEPLKRAEDKRKVLARQQAADIEREARQQSADIEREARKQIAEINEKEKRLNVELAKQDEKNKNAAYKEKAEIDAEIRRWNAEIDQMINNQEDERRDKLVEAIKRYQIDLAKASRDIVNSIGLMSLELREKANNMVLEKTKEYKKIQDEAKKESLLQLKEAKELFFNDDPSTYELLRDNILQERKDMIDMAGQFILTLSKDIENLNANTDKLMQMGMNNVSAYLQPMANALGINETDTTNNTKRITDNSIIELDG